MCDHPDYDDCPDLYAPEWNGPTPADQEELETLEEEGDDPDQDNWWDETDLGYGG